MRLKSWDLICQNPRRDGQTELQIPDSKFYR
jgi:hypothetical protein